MQWLQDNVMQENFNSWISNVWLRLPVREQNVRLPHFWSSSELSPQSSEPSHTQWLYMQWWFPHSNWLDVQNLSGEEKKKEENSAFLKKTIGRYLHWKSLKINTLAFLNCSVFRWQLCETLTTVCFISSILTVVFLITGPAHRNATPAGTSKEVHWTFKLSVIWKIKKRKTRYWISGVLENTKKYIKDGKNIQTWTVSLIREISTVIVAITHPWGKITQSGFLTALERSSFNSKAEETGAISRFWENGNT